MDARMTAEQLARKYERRATALPRELRAAQDRIGIEAVRLLREAMDRLIYATPIPTNKSGRPKWRRTGNLRRNEKWQRVDNETVQVTNTMPYAEPRHEAGKPGRRATTRPAHWRDEVFGRFRGLTLNLYRDTVQSVLKRGG